MLKLIVFKTEKFFPENNVKTFCLCFVQKFSFPERSWHMLDMFYCGKSTWMCLRILLFQATVCVEPHWALDDRQAECSLPPPSTAVPRLAFHRGRILVGRRQREERGEERGERRGLDCIVLGCSGSRPGITCTLWSAGLPGFTPHNWILCPQWRITGESGVWCWEPGISSHQK